LPEIPYDLFSVRGLLFIMLGYGYLMLGKPERGFEIIYEALRTDQTGSSIFYGRLLMTLCFLHWSNTDLLELRQVAR